MRNNIVLFFGQRFLKAKGTILPHLSVLMSSLAIMISVAILIIVTSVMNGFSADLIEKILGLNSHITVYPRNSDKLVNYSKITREIQTIDGVKLTFPVISGSGMIVKDDASIGLFIKGMTANDIKSNKDLMKSITANLSNFDKNYNIILGKGIARQLKVKKGNDVDLIVPVLARTMVGTFPRQVKMKVVGFINSHSQQYDNYMAIISFNAGRAIFGTEGASSVEIITNNPEDLGVIESKISKRNKYYISDWKSENSGLLHALKVESSVMSLILGLFVIISVFTIFAVIRMMIKSKERDIAILKAHGISDFQVGKMFFIVGIVICMFGMLFGNFVGIVFALNVDKIRIFLEDLFHSTLLDGDIYLLSHLPSRIIVDDIIKINIFVFISALICIYLSIKRNIKINITETLRNN